MSHFALICIILLLGCLTASAQPTGPCKAAFRLDDIQEDWLVASQQALINLFVQEDIPLTVGVITGYFGAAYSPQTNGGMATFLDGKLAAGAQIEVASHTIDHVSLQSQTYDVQVGVCTTSRNQIATNLPHNTRPVTTMICPYDQFNNDTLNALRATGYNAMSSMYQPGYCDECDVPPHIFYSSCADVGVINGISHVPSYAQTSTNGNGIRIPDAQVLSAMETACNTCGFSVVEMHFTEFTDANNQPFQVENMTGIFNTLKGWGCTFHLLSDVFATTPAPPVAPVPVAPLPIVTSTPTPSPVPTPTTVTPVPTPSTGSISPSPVPTPSNPTPTSSNPTSDPTPNSPSDPTPSSPSDSPSNNPSLNPIDNIGGAPSSNAPSGKAPTPTTTQTRTSGSSTPVLALVLVFASFLFQLFC